MFAKKSFQGKSVVAISFGERSVPGKPDNIEAWQ
jgi:hypothetical protein